MSEDDRYAKLHFGLVVMLLFVLFIGKSYGSPLSVRNNNAGNIKYVKSNNWVGQVGHNKGFVKFDTKEHGIRATKLVIKANIKATRSVHCFVLRYASQPNESMANKHIQNYSRAISSMLGRDYILESDVEQLTPLIVYLEGGSEATKYFYGDTNWKKYNYKNQSSLNTQSKHLEEDGMSEKTTNQYLDICTKMVSSENQQKTKRLVKKADIFQQKRMLLWPFLSTMREKYNERS